MGAGCVETIDVALDSCHMLYHALSLIDNDTVLMLMNQRPEGDHLLCKIQQLSRHDDEMDRYRFMSNKILPPRLIQRGIQMPKIQNPAFQAVLVVPFGRKKYRLKNAVLEHRQINQI